LKTHSDKERKIDEEDEEIGKDKDSIANHFENIIHIQITTASRNKKEKKFNEKDKV